MLRIPTASPLRSNRGALLVLLVLIGLLPLLIAKMAAAHRDERAKLDSNLAFAAERHAAALENYFARARALTQVIARNPAFRQFYQLPGTRTDKVRRQGSVIRDANAALAYLEQLFPDSIGEACFIDRGGAENARAVTGVIAPLAELSPDETGAPFFTSTFALRSSQVYHSLPYVSPDTNEWVIANSAPVVMPDGSTPAIVHFEVTLESFRAMAASEGDSYSIQIVDRRTGDVIVDSARPIREGGRLISPGDDRLRWLAGATERSGHATVDDHRVAFEPVETPGENANDWIVVATAGERAESWLASLGAFEVAIFVGALALLLVAATSLRGSQRELRVAAMTDSLTGLGNRRHLMADLERALASAAEGRSVVFALFDLDGFKDYNDTFGHPAGDALLARLARRLHASVDGTGTAYRMGGDEFCVIAPDMPGRRAEAVAAAAAASLGEHGEGFTVTASHGAVRLPEDASTPADALRLADSRMHLDKASNRRSAVRQSMDVLTRVLAERSADLHDHLDGVASMAQVLAEGLGLASDEVAEIRRAAAVHDIGKVAIPDAILSKPGPLTEEEWTFMRRHTVIGERILAAAPSLARVARIVRATHEQVDGKGYPDGLRGEEIPLGARIIAVCDAFEAMTSDRPYSDAMSVEVAVDELRRCAGTQFDARVVEVFCTEVLARMVEPRSARTAA